MYLPATETGAPPKLAYVFQEPVLLPWRTVLQNLHLVMTEDQISARTGGAAPGRGRLGEVADAFPGTLSLGMSRRVSLVRAFAVEPDILLMDEPFVSLDEADGGHPAWSVDQAVVGQADHGAVRHPRQP